MSRILELSGAYVEETTSPTLSEVLVAKALAVVGHAGPISTSEGMRARYIPMCSTCFARSE
jgi:hypothetical protein